MPYEDTNIIIDLFMFLPSRFRPPVRVFGGLWLPLCDERLQIEAFRDGGDVPGMPGRCVSEAGAHSSDPCLDDTCLL